MSTVPTDVEAGTSYGLLRQPREVVFGPGQRRAVASIVAGVGGSVGVITDERMSQQSFFAELIASLEAAGVRVAVFNRTTADLPVEDVQTAVETIHQALDSVEVILGVGGGSCLDLAKLVSLMLSHGGTLSDYYGEFAVPGPVVPIVALPTTSGTGSEVTPVAVVSDTALGSKVGISSPHLIPYAAICDPELTATCPPGLTASTGADALSHLIEAFTARRREPTPELRSERVAIGRNSLTDYYARTGLGLISDSLRTAVHDGGGGPHRDDVMMAAFCGGMAFGTAGTAAAHAFQYPIGALTHTPHGVGVGCLLPYVMAFNGPSRSEEMAAITRLLGGEVGTDPTVSAVRVVADLLSDIGIPTTLAELGVTASQVDRIVKNGLQARRLIENNPVPIDEAAARQILRNAFDGTLP